MTKHSPFHVGEEAVQERAGVRELAAQIGRIIRPAMTIEHRLFFEDLPYVVVGAATESGEPFATMLAGRPGFVTAPDQHTLMIEAAPVAGDPITPALRPGAPIGVLGIQLATRRRNRANGVVIAASPDRLTIAIDESFGNCPQYIQARSPLAATQRPPPHAEREGALLSPEALAVVAAADTTFVASTHLTADVSHRGGKPGFIRASDEHGATVLTMPDFAGNNLYMTLGNLHANARAGLALVDFATGTLLSLTGTTEIVWDGPAVDAFTGAERLLCFRVIRGARLEGAIPLAWSAPDYARQLARTGSWAARV